MILTWAVWLAQPNAARSVWGPENMSAPLSAATSFAGPAFKNGLPMRYVSRSGKGVCLRSKGLGIQYLTPLLNPFLLRMRVPYVANA
jgi:hypothetical protein